ncbi:hypothetical protein PHLCEN_2v2629, partial [Hermanssonia centrifuga]
HTSTTPNSYQDMHVDDPLGAAPMDNAASSSESSTASQNNSNYNAADYDLVDSVWKLNDIKIEYHPKTKIPSRIYWFADYGQDCNTTPASAFASDPWLPGFDNCLDFEFAELVLECTINRKQIDRLIGIAHCVANDPLQFLFTKYDDLKNAWDIAGKSHPPVVAVPYKKEDCVVELYTRNIWKLAVQQAQDPILALYFYWKATHNYKWDGLDWV